MAGIPTDRENKSKRSYSNADLRAEGGPATVYGDWKVTKVHSPKPRNKQDALYEQMISDGTTIDDIMRDARRVTDPLDRAEADSNRVMYDRQAAAAQERAQRGSSKSRVMRDALATSMLVPALAVSGPAGWAAGAGMAGNALANAYEDEGQISAGDAAMAGLGVLPVARIGRGITKAGSAANRFFTGADIPGRRSWFGAREVPYRMSESTAMVPRTPPTDAMAAAAGQRATGAHRVPGLPDVRSPRPASAGPGGPPNVEITDLGNVPQGQLAGSSQRMLPPGQKMLPPARSSMDALLEDTVMPEGFGMVDDVAEAQVNPGVEDALGLMEHLGVNVRRPAQVQRFPLGARSRPNARQFGRELQGVQNLEESEIASLLDALTWARR